MEPKDIKEFELLSPTQKVNAGTECVQAVNLEIGRVIEAISATTMVLAKWPGGDG